MFQRPGRPVLDGMHVKINPGAEDGMLPLRMFARMFPELLQDNGGPKPGTHSIPISPLENYKGNIK